MLDMLKVVSPGDIVAAGEEMLLKAFKRAAARVPAYKKILEEAGCVSDRVDSIAAFKDCVPIINKESIFPRFSIKELCLDGNWGRIRSVMSSSGFSGVYSFGVTSEENYGETVQGIDAALDYMFATATKNTLFINGLSMGVRVPTSLPTADTSVRWDMALAIYKKFYQEFDQVVIIGDPHFLKIYFEEGIAQGIAWKDKNIHLITGGDWMPETYRSYLGDILGTDWETMDRGLIGGTMGVAELDLNLFHESRDSIRIQRAVLRDTRLRYALYGEGCDVQPTLFHYYPHRTFLEVINRGDGMPELVISMLSESLLIPLLRYNVGDVARIYSYEEIQTILRDCGYGQLCPELKLPLVAIGGRKTNLMPRCAICITPQAVKHGMYEDFEAAALTTGCFRVAAVAAQAAEGMIEVQLRKGVAETSASEAIFRRTIEKYVPAPFQLKIYPYAAFPYSMELDYERKLRNS